MIKKTPKNSIAEQVIFISFAAPVENPWLMEFYLMAP